MQNLRRTAGWGLLVFLLAACVREQPQVIVITATFPGEPQVLSPGDATAFVVQPTQMAVAPVSLSPVPSSPLSVPTLDPTLPGAVSIPEEYTVQPGDTLFVIAQKFNMSMEALQAANDLLNPDVLSVGQVLKLPDASLLETPNFKIIPDSRLVRAPGSAAFDIAGFVGAQPGYIRNVTDTVETRSAAGVPLERTLNAAQIVERVALEYSVDPRLLLALLEFRAQWLTNPQPAEALLTHPLISLEASIGVERAGMYKQLAWAANELNRGYYGWKSRGIRVVEFAGGATRLLYANGLNAGTIALHYFLSLNYDYTTWVAAISPDGLYRVYYGYFGDPFLNSVDPLVPITLEQPTLTLPFVSGEVWFYTGGAHGGWGAGSAWSSVDFAPPDERTDSMALCYTSQYAVRAVAPGVIARSGDGTVILDLDGDGDESTGWTILYLHLDNLVPQGVHVKAGDMIANAACAGGYSPATHLHIGRRFNGEWIPADCQECLPGHERPPFVMSGWRVVGIPDQEYQGYLEQGTSTVIAEQGRTNPVNRISW